MKERTYMPMRIEDIKISNRYRKDLGDVESLAKSIDSIGLLNPITVTYDGELIAGQRRVEAFKLLGLDEIDVIKVKDLETAVQYLTAERDENEERKEMTVSEKVALAQALEEMEKPKAAKRRHEAAVRAGKIRQGTYKPDDSASCPGEQEAEKTDSPGLGNVRDIVGEAVGMSHSSYQRASAVVKAAEDPETPSEVRQIAQQALNEMDETGKITPAYEKVREAKVGESERPAIPKRSSAAATKQRKALNAAGPVLDGLCMGLEQIVEAGLDEAIDAEEAAQWVDGLAKSRRTIERVINLLKERSNA